MAGELHRPALRQCSRSVVASAGGDGPENRRPTSPARSRRRSRARDKGHEPHRDGRARRRPDYVTTHVEVSGSSWEEFLVSRGAEGVGECSEGVVPMFAGRLQPGEALNLRLQLGNARFKIFDAILLKLLAGHTRHGCDFWCDGGCECRSQYSGQMPRPSPVGFVVPLTKLQGGYTLPTRHAARRVVPEL